MEAKPPPRKDRPSFEERRDCVRLAVDFQGTCSVAGSSSPARITEIARNGLRLLVQRQIPFRTIVLVTFECTVGAAKSRDDWTVSVSGAVARRVTETGPPYEYYVSTDPRKPDLQRSVLQISLALKLAQSTAKLAQTASMIAFATKHGLL